MRRFLLLWKKKEDIQSCVVGKWYNFLRLKRNNKHISEAYCPVSAVTTLSSCHIWALGNISIIYFESKCSITAWWTWWYISLKPAYLSISVYLCFSGSITISKFKGSRPGLAIWLIFIFQRTKRFARLAMMHLSRDPSPLRALFRQICFVTGRHH